MSNQDRKDLARIYQIGKKLSDTYSSDKKLVVSEVISLARDKKSLYNLLIKWDDAPSEKKDDILNQIKAKIPKKKRPFGN